MDTQSIIIIALFAIYYVAVIYLSFRIILENRNPLKTQSYLLLMVFLPGVGLLIYLVFGVNYRKRKMFNRQAAIDQQFIEALRVKYSERFLERQEGIVKTFPGKERLPSLFWRNSYSPITANNRVTLLNNGERKYPVFLDKLKEANHHIHIEYYIFIDDHIGQKIIQILCEKASSGVEVRLIFDSIGSVKLRNSAIKKMRAAGVQVCSYNPVIFPYLANRVNYRDHRKIVVIDGKVGFTGGINVSDYYVNKPNDQDFWRDTHCMIEGEAVFGLQLLFFLNWFFVSKEPIGANAQYFPRYPALGDVRTIIIPSAPDSDSANLMEAYFSLMTSAEKELFIITPYFIPNDSILTAMKIAAKSGVRVILLLPKKSDTMMVHAASLTYLGELMRNDVEVYLYEKGMIHSKVIIVDEQVSTIGTANMDYRSFDSNAEVNAFFFDKKIAEDLKLSFLEDLTHAQRLDLSSWKKRSIKVKIIGSAARLLAPLL